MGGPEKIKSRGREQVTRRANVKGKDKEEENKEH